MAKRKTAPTDASRHHQFEYTSTSESVKTRPRKKRVLNVPPPQVDVKTLSHLNPHAQPQAPAPEHLLELTAIWNADQRTPSVLSRRAWALARNLRVEAVQRWWHRRRQTAKRAGETLLEETYELDVGTPPVLVEDVKMEEKEAEETRRGVVRNTRGRAKRAKMEMQDSDSLLSSDTLVSSPPVSRKRAYIDRSSSLVTSRSTSPLPPSSPPALSSSPAPSSPPPRLQPKPEWCIRNGPGSGFTCSLCSSGPDTKTLDTDASVPTSPSPPPQPFIFPSADEPLTPPIIPTRWCIVGRHYALDGSLIGRCVCGPVAWGGCELEDVLCPPSSLLVEDDVSHPPSSSIEDGFSSSSVEDGLCPPLMVDESRPPSLMEDALHVEA